MRSAARVFRDLHRAKTHLGFGVQPTFCGLPHFILADSGGRVVKVSRNVLEPADTIRNRVNGRKPPRPTCERCLASW